jgi:hypothetical protein
VVSNSARVIARAATIAVAVGAAAIAAGCASVELAPPRVHSRSGPATAAAGMRVLAVPATCGSLQLQRDLRATTNDPGTVEECSRTTVNGIDQAVRAALDFAGYQVIDPERLNVETALRHERYSETNGSGVLTTETVGARFGDVTPLEQTRIIKQLGATGVLDTRVWVGAAVGASERRIVMVQVRLSTAAEGRLVWARRCELEVGAVLDPQAMDRAARCAVEGIKRP